jgi:hypothetical protein
VAGSAVVFCVAKILFMRWIFLLLVFAGWQAAAQKPQPVVVMDFVRVKEARFAEALFFYENNWKLYRDEALRQGFITGYRVLQTKPDSAANFDLVLLTEYADSLQYNNSEKNFEGIIKHLRPNGPKLLNDMKPADFRQNLFFKAGNEIFASPKRKDEN